MPQIDAILEEFERTLPATRRYLERIPEDKLRWRPAAKSMNLGQLALHIALSPGEVAELGVQDSAELPEFNHFPEPASTAAILDAFDQSVKTVQELLPGTSDERLEGQLTFTVKGQVAAAMPRITFFRDIFLNHTYHHRGQLSVYLRELDVPLPWTFGPTADEAQSPSV